MSASGSRAQFGEHVQQSLGPDFDRYVGEMYRKGSYRERERSRGAGPDSAISMGMGPDTVSKITGTGEIRNGFAPGARLLHNSPTYAGNRRMTEEHVFDIPEDADHTRRPVYGYLRDTRHPEPGMYGHALMDVHPNPRRAVTTSGGDSLDGFLDAHSEHDDPHEAASMLDVEDLNDHHEPWPSDGNYREVQVHGGPIDLRREVTKAHLFRSQYNTRDVDRAKEELKMARVPTKVYQHMEYQPTLDKELFGEGKTGWVDEEAHRQF